jgi:hypothetical protein
LVVIKHVQGDIEILSKVFLVAKIAQIKLISYIPSDFMPVQLNPISDGLL